MVSFLEVIYKAKTAETIISKIPAPIPTIVGVDTPDLGSCGGVGVIVGVKGVAVGAGVAVAVGAGVAVAVGVGEPDGAGVGVGVPEGVGVGVAAEMLKLKGLQAMGAAAAGLDVGTLGATAVCLN